MTLVSSDTSYTVTTAGVYLIVSNGMFLSTYTRTTNFTHYKNGAQISSQSIYAKDTSGNVIGSGYAVFSLTAANVSDVLQSVGSELSGIFGTKIYKIE